MNRFSKVAALVAVAISIVGCASGKTRRPSVATQPSGRACPTNPNGGWIEIESEGFNFCVPNGWYLDTKFESRHKMHYPSLFKMVSYAAPDTMQRVVFEVPAGSGASAELDQTLETCGTQRVYDTKISIARGPGCMSGSTSWTLNAPQPIYTNVSGSRLAPPMNDYRPMTTITYSIPHIRGRALGPGVAGAILYSVRSTAQR